MALWQCRCFDQVDFYAETKQARHDWLMPVAQRRLCQIGQAPVVNPQSNAWRATGLRTLKRLCVEKSTP